MKKSYKILLDLVNDKIKHKNKFKHQGYPFKNAVEIMRYVAGYGWAYEITYRATNGEVKTLEVYGEDVFDALIEGLDK